MAKRKTPAGTVGGKKRVVLHSGESFAVLSEDGRYFYCEGTRFRRENADILRVEDVCGHAKEEADAKSNDNAPQSGEESAG